MNGCECEQCSNACSIKPGWFMPGEAEKVADYLGKSLQELFDTHLGVDWWVSDLDVFLLTPATKNMESGQEYDSNPRGVCVFFDNGLCTIHSVKPYECKEYMHNDTSTKVSNRHKLVADAWHDYQDSIGALLGREPQSLELSLLNMFSLW